MAKRIAVVNDNQKFLELMEEILREEGGYQVLLLHETSSAFRKLEEFGPDAIILDMLLEHPDSGWELLELLRLHPATRDTPVVICTADVRGVEERAELLRRHGCTTLLKPFDIDELLGLLAPVLRTGEAPPEG